MQINDSNYPPSKQLHADIKAAFVRKESSFTSWCKANGFGTSNVRMAIFGSWNGPKAKAIRKQIIEESGLAQQAA